ncbi:MAG: trigger factor [Bacillota bacterium]
MKVSVERLPNSQAALDVEVEHETVEDAIQKAYINLVKNVNIPGFRRGKAPRKILERYVGKQRLYDEALEELVPETYSRAVKEAGLEPVDRPDVDILQFGEGQNLRYKATVTIKPEVKLKDYRSIAVALEPVVVDQEKVQRVVDALLEARAVLESAAEDAVLEKGMFASLEVVSLGERKVPSLDQENYLIELGKEQVLPGVDTQLEGARAGEERTITACLPEDMPDDDLKGAEVQLKITVKNLKTKQLPELNDEFVKSLGGKSETVQELLEEIKNNLQRSGEEQARRAQIEEVNGLLLAQAEVDIPNVMVENKIDGMVREFQDTLANRGLDLERYLAASGRSLDELRSSMSERARRAVKLELTLEAVAEAEQIRATPQDIDDLLVDLAKRYRQTPDALRALFVQRQGGMEHLEAGVITDKTVDFLSKLASANAQKGQVQTQEQEKEEEVTS